MCVEVISTPQRNKSLKTATCGRCIIRCKLSWPPGEWPVKRCLCSRSSRGWDDMSVSQDHFLSAFFRFDRSVAEEIRKLLVPSADRWRIIALCLRRSYRLLSKTRVLLQDLLPL